MFELKIAIYQRVASLVSSCTQCISHAHKDNKYFKSITPGYDM